MEELGIIVDISHASEQVIDDVLSAATKPVVASHTGLKGTCNTPRNLKDEHVRKIAATGGMVSITYFEHALCGTEISDLIRTVKYAADLVGVEHVGMGSDWDGFVSTLVDVTGLPVLTHALLEAGFTRDEVGLIQGGNLLRILRNTLPAQ